MMARDCYSANQIDLTWFAARLSIAVYDLNMEQRMSIQSIREELKHLPGAASATMAYGKGGASQIFTFGEVSFEVRPSATSQDIEAAFLEAKKKRQS